MSSEKPIHVLHVITRLIQGGAQMNTLATASALGPPRYRSSIATSGPDPGEKTLHEEARRRGIRLHIIPELQREISPWLDLKAWLKIRHLIQSEEVDILHTHTSKAGILGRCAGVTVRPRPLIVHTPHGHVFYGYFGRSKTRMFILMERSAALFTDSMVALTEAEKRDHDSLHILPRRGIQVIPSGIDLNRFRSATPQTIPDSWKMKSGDCLIGSVGRLTAIKGHEVLLRAFAALPDTPHLVLVGEGELRTVLESLAQELGVSSRVHFWGFDPDVSRILKAMDLFVLPSLNEGMGRALVEAMAAGRCCVASSVGGIVDLIQDQETGILVPPRDPSLMERVLKELIRSPEDRGRLGERAALWVQDCYSEESMTTRLGMLYDQLIQERSGNRMGGDPWTKS